MKLLLWPVCLSALLVTTTVAAGQYDNRHHNNQHFTDHARVLSAEPQFRVVIKKTPQRTCQQHAPRNHYQHHGHNNKNHTADRKHSARNRHHKKPEAVFIGAVIGGAIGHEITKSVNGHANVGTTLAGAALGAGLVSSHQQRQQKRHHTPKRSHHKPATHCTTTQHSQRVRVPDGYLVTYRYRGRTFQTHTEHHPGDKIAVQVSLSMH